MLVNQLNPDGFELLHKIIFTLSPQLGGEAQDLQQLVSTLDLVNGEDLPLFLHKAQKLSNIITLQQDTTGQNNRLTHRFITLLYAIPDYKCYLHEYVHQANQHLKLHNNHSKTFPFSMDISYQLLIDSDACTTVNMPTPDSAPQPVVDTSNDHNDYDHQMDEPVVNYSNRTTDNRRPSRRPDPRQNQRNATQNNRFDTTSTASNRPRQQQYKPTRCTACNLTQRDVHRLLSTIHQGKSNNFCFRGPKFNSDKNMRTQLEQ